MPRKKFEEAEEERYSPLDADLLRDAAAVGRQPKPTAAVEAPDAPEAPTAPSTPRAPEKPPVTSSGAARKDKVLELPRPVPRKPAVHPKPQPQAASQPTKEAARRGRTSDGPTKRVRINSEEDRAVARFLGRLYEDTGTRIYLSQLARAGWALALRAEEEIHDELAKHPLPSLPSTQDSVSYADYEERVLALLHRAIRRAKLS